MRADIHRRMGINKGVEREILVELVDVTAQIQTVFIPVKNDTANSWVMFDKLKQVDAILRPDNLKPLLLQRTLKFLDGLIFIKDAMRSHDGNDIHAILPKTLVNHSLVKPQVKKGHSVVALFRINAVYA